MQDYRSAQWIFMTIIIAEKKYFLSFFDAYITVKSYQGFKESDAEKIFLQAIEYDNQYLFEIQSRQASQHFMLP